MRLPVSTSVVGPGLVGIQALSFLRHEQIYRPVSSLSWAKAQQCPAAPAPSHRLDESAIGYSLAGCSPAEPASASPTIFILRRWAVAVNRCSLPGVHNSACGSVFLDIIWNACRPDLPKNTHPGSGKYADSVRMSATARSGICVNSGSPRRPAAGVVRQERDGNAQSVIASPAKGHSARFAALLGYWSNARFGSKLLGICQPLTDIPYLAKDLRGSKVARIRQAHQQYPIFELCDFRFDARCES